MKLLETTTLKMNTSIETNKYGTFYTVSVYVYDELKLGTMLMPAPTLSCIGNGTARSSTLATALAFENLAVMYKKKNLAEKLKDETERLKKTEDAADELL